MHTKPLLLNNKVSDYVPMHFDKCAITNELFGIEVELEGAGGITNATQELLSIWDVHNDGSLRKLKPNDEAIEYVTRVPGTMDETLHAVKVLTTFLNNPKLKVYDSYRTSIHVHVNCMADTMMQVCNFITLCILFDELLTSQNGDHRIGNNFCLRSKDAEGQIIDLIKSIEMNGNIFGVSQNNRYSSINFASLNKFGTVEFRSLECTIDPLRIVHWVRTIDHLKRASRTFENPQDVIRKFSQLSAQEYLFTALETCAPKYYKVLGYEDMLFNGMRLAQEFAYCSKWVVKELNRGERKPSTDWPALKKNQVAQYLEQQALMGNNIAIQAADNGGLAVDIEVMPAGNPQVINSVPAGFPQHDPEPLEYPLPEWEDDDLGPMEEDDNF